MGEDVTVEDEVTRDRGGLQTVGEVTGTERER